MPNNGTPSGTTYNVSITTATNNPVQISGINPTISGLTLGSANSLTLNNGQALAIVATTPSPGTTVSNAGTITLNSSGILTDLILSGANGFVTLSGGGTVAMSNNADNRIFGAIGNETLVNANNTIQGSGQLGVGLLAITNQGTINANQASALTINPNAAGVTNNGTLEATAGGTLDLLGSYANTNGTILSTGAGSTVNIFGKVAGGTLTTASGGTMNSNSGVGVHGPLLLSGGDASRTSPCRRSRPIVASWVRSQ